MYSTNPQDWYFDIDEEADPVMIALSLSPSMLDDQLGSNDLPDEIIDLLSPIGIDMDVELMESIWEVTSDKPKAKLIKEIKALGFNYQKGLLA